MDPSTPMPVGMEVNSATQWKAYLERYPELKADAVVLELTEEKWRIIQAVNTSVNAGRWVPEERDDWDHVLPGDCENFALQKRRRLHSNGIHLGALRLCVGLITRRRKRQGHAALHVVTDRGDYVLDNLTNEVLPWSESRLRPLYRTAGGATCQLFLST